MAREFGHHPQFAPKEDGPPGPSCSLGLVDKGNQILQNPFHTTGVAMVALITFVGIYFLKDRLKSFLAPSPFPPFPTSPSPLSPVEPPHSHHSFLWGFRVRREWRGTLRPSGAGARQGGAAAARRRGRRKTETRKETRKNTDFGGRFVAQWVASFVQLFLGGFWW